MTDMTVKFERASGKDGEISLQMDNEVAVSDLEAVLNLVPTGAIIDEVNIS